MTTEDKQETTIKFTRRALKVLNFAHQEAKRFNQNYIGTEHLLVSLIHEGGGLGAKMLGKLGADEELVRKNVGLAIDHHKQGGYNPTKTLLRFLRRYRFLPSVHDSWDAIGMTPGARKSIELALEEAQRFNHRFIGTEHLLLGLIREGEGLSGRVLENLGADLKRVRTQVFRS